MSSKTSVAYGHVQQELEQLLTVWQARLILPHWRIQLVFLDTYRDAEDNTDMTPAECDAQWAALHAEIKFWLPVIAGYTDETLEWLIVHELAHVLLAPEQDGTKPSMAAQMELATEMVARALLAAWNSA